jgi:hypothetical protein
VDAVCINQQDLLEQGVQVRMMWDIYAAAERVVLWLGSITRDSTKAMENFGKKAAQTRLAAREGFRCRCHAGDGLTHPDRVGVQNLIARQWFTRVWVRYFAIHEWRQPLIQSRFCRKSPLLKKSLLHVAIRQLVGLIFTMR